MTYQHHNNAIIPSRSNLVKIISESSAISNAMFKVIKSNTKIAITPP